MNKIRKYLQQPFPISPKKWEYIIGISVFIAFFLNVFQPFGLTTFKSEYKFYILSGFGLVTFCVLVINLVVIEYIFAKSFCEEIWTVAREIAWLGWIILTIGLGNAFYSYFAFSIFDLTLAHVLNFVVFTFIIGVIPAVSMVIIQQNYWLRKNNKSAQDLNQSVTEHAIQNKSNETIRLIADNDKDQFSIPSSQLLYIESTGNYIDVFYSANEAIKRTTLRSTLKRVDSQLKNYSEIIQCHRAFIVNLSKIESVSGNSQGLKLKLTESNTYIPVSRAFVNIFRKKILQIA